MDYLSHLPSSKYSLVALWAHDSIFLKFLFIYDSHTERDEREAETQAEGEAGYTHQEPDAGLNPGSPGSCPGPKAGAKPLCHPGIPHLQILIWNQPN